MTIVDSGMVEGTDRAWLRAKFPDDAGHREGEISVENLHRLFDPTPPWDGKRVSLDAWRQHTLAPPVEPIDGRYVYVITCLGSSVPIVKIGIAASPEKRVKQLATSSPHALRLEFARYFDNAKAIEVAAHEHFHDRRQNGEWFAIQPGDAISFLTQDVQ